MAETTAWLLALDRDLYAAVGKAEIVHFLEQPVFFDVPGSPFYCRRVVVWQNRVLPALDLAAWLHGKIPQRDRALVAVTVYQDSPGSTLSYGGLILSSMPLQIQVADEQACDLPQRPRTWQSIAISCFAREGQPVPILDLRYIYSDALMLV